MDTVTKISNHQGRNVMLGEAEQKGSKVEIKRCPKCHSKDRYRVSRAFWMRWLKNSKRYECSACRHKYLTFM